MSDRIEDYSRALAQQLPAVRMLVDEPLCRHTTFQIGGPARLMVAAPDADSLAASVRLARQYGIRHCFLGNGSNVLAADEGYDGVIFLTAPALTGVEVDGQVITAQSGVLLSRCATAAQRHGLSGLEFAHGIPGTVGGAVYMNAGAYGGEIAQCLLSSTCLTAEGEIVTLSREEHAFSYRYSDYKAHPERLILSASFGCQPGDPAQIRAVMADLSHRRSAKQPLELPSAGSVFKRPEGHYAGQLIEQAGLKGCRIGGAQVSPKHCGFIVNIGQATCRDVLALIDHIQQTVYRQFGVMLECEIRQLS